MNNSPLITCVIPTYRRPRILARAIRSVLNQTFPRLRVFVTDNASGDETEEIVRRIQASDPRVIYFCQPENLGMNANFSYGMSRIETPFYSLLSDDDILLPEFYEVALTEFQKYPQAILVATLVPSVTEDGRIISMALSSWDRMGLFDPPTGAHRVAAIAHPELPGILFRREFLETPYAHPNPGTHAADYEIILNSALHYPIVTVGRLGACFIQHRGARAKPTDPFSIVDHHLGLILSGDLDDRFPPPVKAGNRKRWLRVLSFYLRDLVIQLALDGDLLASERALTILSEDVGRADLSAKLRLLHQLCQSLPSLRPQFRTLVEVLLRFRSRLLQSRRPLLDPRYRELLKLG